MSCVSDNENQGVTVLRGERGCHKPGALPCKACVQAHTKVLGHPCDLGRLCAFFVPLGFGYLT